MLQLLLSDFSMREKDIIAKRRNILNFSCNTLITLIAEPLQYQTSALCFKWYKEADNIAEG